MGPISDRILDAVSNVAGPTFFPYFSSRQYYAVTFMAVFTDAAAAGALKVQWSNDVASSGDLPSSFLPTNWLDVPSATVTVAAGATSFIPMPTQICYRWLRLVWTRTAGAGTFTVFMNAQGL